MNNDLDVIVKTFPLEWEYLNVYALGDVHVGSPQFNEDAVRAKIDIIRNDPQGVVCLCGDLGDFGLKNSKTNVYQATMQPKDQIDYIYELFKPVADRIISHELSHNYDLSRRKLTISYILAHTCVFCVQPSVYDKELYTGKLKNIGLLDFASTPV